MDDMVKQVLGGWIRAGVAAVAGGMGYTEWVNGDVGTAVVGLGVAIAMALWSTLQKTGSVKA